MKTLEIVSKKEIVAGESYDFNGHEIICDTWTERGKNGNNNAAQFIGTIDGKPFKGSVTDLKKKVGASVLAKADKGTPEQIFATYMANIKNIVGLPSYYLTAIEKAEKEIAKAKAEAEKQATKDVFTEMLAKLRKAGYTEAQIKAMLK